MLFYRIKQNMPLEMPVAVVVQRMVNSEKSGVMFTSDPSTRDPSRMVIEAAWGLGEAVVQGAVTPDRHVLDKKSLSVLDTAIARKEFLLTWDDKKQSTTRVDLTGDPRARCAGAHGGRAARRSASWRVARRSTTACRRISSSRLKRTRCI